MKVVRFFSLLVFSFLFLTPVSQAAESDVDRLLDLLVEKKVVTAEDATLFKADLAIKKQEEKETQKEFLVVAGKPIKISGYTQLRYRQDKSINDTFDIRRARLNIQGDITERFDYRTQIEFGGTAVNLLDAIIGYKVNPYVKLTLGQTFIPFSLENLTSNTKLETINRSQVVEALVARGSDVIGNQNGRDIGIQAGGSILPKEDYNLVDYAFGIFNGSGINKSDTNEQKDFVGRLVFRPLKALSAGASYYAGRYTLTATPARIDGRHRYGLEFAYAQDPVSFRGEYIKGNDGAVNKDGWYVQAGYFFIPKKFQGVFKFDTYDPNTKLDNNESTVYTLGGNWYFNKWAFLQVNYELKDERAKEIGNNALTGQFTLQF
jgi:phosphate-selective porin